MALCAWCSCRYVFRGEGLEPGSAAAGKEEAPEEAPPSTEGKQKTKKKKGEKGKGSAAPKAGEDDELEDRHPVTGTAHPKLGEWKHALALGLWGTVNR